MLFKQSKDNYSVDFLNLVQKKEHKTDNRIIIVTVFSVVLIMSFIVFWPTSSKHSLLTYLPNNTSFYYHFTNKVVFLEDFFNQDVPENKISYLEDILGNNFLNLQEVLWFQVNGKQNDNYLLRFSRLPKDILDDLGKDSNFQLFSPQKNILLINSGPKIDLSKINSDKDIYFEKGVSIYWKKNKAPDFLKGLSKIVEPIFTSEEVLLNWQKLEKDKNKISLLESSSSGTKDIKNFLVPKDFDLAFGFINGMPSALAEDSSIVLLKTFFDSLPYYNLNKEVIKNRILTDSILWQKDDAWILASNKKWQEDILDFVDSFVVEEVPKVLQDGTAYVELVASDNQNIKEYNINGQQVFQIGDLFIWDIDNQHYLSNQKALIEDLSSDNRYLSSILDNCLNQPVKIEDFIYIKDKAVLKQIMIDYLPINNIKELQVVSYTTGTTSGLNICF